MTAYDVIKHKLETEMHEGNMHGCLRDVSRLAGGYASTGALSAMDLFSLEDLAVSLSINKNEGRDKWTKGVVFGRGQPVDWEESQYYQPKDSKEFGWEDEIGNIDNLKIIDPRWVEDIDVSEPGDEWNPKADLIRFIHTLFEGDQHVAYTTESWQKDGKFLPTKGNWDRTSSQLITELQNTDDIHAVFGDCNSEVGAWIRLNPFDGNGIKDENVTDFRFALVECDNMEISKQYALLKELELPIATLVHSGKKSLHAAIRIDADTMESYRKRVDFLYEICKKNGLEIDRQNRNPSRLSRMPGVTRAGKKQFLIDTNIGKCSWNEWEEWIQDLNDDLPDFENIESIENLPDKAPELIEGILREGHKMRLAGPSKAGKSFALIQLCVSIAEGRRWFGWKCRQGPVLYINLELDRASCLHRFADVYKANGWKANNLNNIDIWNLRGKSMPMDKLAPKLIRRAMKKGYKAIVIDPIYKVTTGDENSAEAMSYFCNQFDKICAELGCAVIDAHHHSKGAQGNKKADDRASGSGVFRRDPDANIDMIELQADDARAVLLNDSICAVISLYMDEIKPNWRDHVGQDDSYVEKKLEPIVAKMLSGAQRDEMHRLMMEERIKCDRVTGWRVEGSLREFASFDPVELWFKYPIHMVEESALKDAYADGEESWKSKKGEKKLTAKERKEDRKESLLTAIDACGLDDKLTVNNIAEYMGNNEKTVKRHLKEFGYKYEHGLVSKNEEF